MTAVLQNYARQTHTPIDTLHFDVVPRDDIEPTQLAHVPAAEQGALVHGLSLQGARYG